MPKESRVKGEGLRQNTLSFKEAPIMEAKKEQLKGLKENQVSSIS